MFNTIKDIYCLICHIDAPEVAPNIADEDEKDSTSENLRQVNFNLYSDEAIDFALAESEKLLAETLVVFRKTNDVSFVVLSLYMGIIGFGINKVIGVDGMKNLTMPMIIIFFGTIDSLYCLWPNIGTGSMHQTGQLPDVLIRPINENVPLNFQIRKFKVSKLIANQDFILHNRYICAKRNKNIIDSVKILLVFFVLALLSIAIVAILRACL